MNKQPNTGIDNLLTDLDRTLRRQKICKKLINQNINNVTELLQNSLNDLSSNKIEEVSKFYLM